MSDKDAFGEMRRGKEEEYFKRKEKELLDKLKERRRLEAEREGLAQAVGTADEAVLRDLQELGYTRETVSLLHLAPLVYVAWAEGSVSKAEHDLIVKAARARGIEEGSAADRELARWLEKKPSDEFFRATLRIIGHLAGSQAGEEQTGASDLFSYCRRVAAASGGILGLGAKVSGEEERVLMEISAALERSHQAAARKLMEDEA
jgi:hypothetical protein